MLREERVARLSFDPVQDVLVLESEGSLPAHFSGAIEARLLLDARGFLVGLDLGDPETPARLVLMIGRHEDVDHTLETTVTLTPSRNGVRIAKAKSAVRAHERNPHAP